MILGSPDGLLMSDSIVYNFKNNKINFVNCVDQCPTVSSDVSNDMLSVASSGNVR